MNKLGDFIRKNREEKGLSLRELARRCDLSHSYIDSLEKGYDGKTKKNVSPTVDTLVKISKGLGVDIKDLFLLSTSQLPTGYDETFNEILYPLESIEIKQVPGRAKRINSDIDSENLNTPKISPDELALIEKYRRMKDHEKDTMHKVADTIAPDDEQAATFAKGC